MEEELVVQFSPQAQEQRSGFMPFRLIKEIWREITFGVGTWGAFRPLVAVLVAIIPGLYLGQHFNRKHRKGFDWFLLQIPLALTVILWIALWMWSIFDAWRDALAFDPNSKVDPSS